MLLSRYQSILLCHILKKITIYCIHNWTSFHTWSIAYFIPFCKWYHLHIILKCMQVPMKLLWICFLYYQLELPRPNFLITMLLQWSNCSTRNHIPCIILYHDHLSPSFHAFVSTLSFASIPTGTSAIFPHSKWWQAMVDEMIVMHMKET